MAEDSIEKQLHFFFPKPTRKDWEKIAVQETNGKDPFEMLSWRGKDDIKFLPYYDAQDISNPAAENAQRTHRWLNLPAIVVSDETDANKIARQHLTRGANGVFFYLKQRTASGIEVLAHDIDLSVFNLFLRFNNEQQFEDVFSKSENAVLDKLNGALFWESIPKTGKLSRAFSRWKDLRTLGIVIPPSSPAREIAHALLEGVNVYERFHQTADAGDVFHSICFSITADVSFLETTAKIMALRALWLQIERAYGHDDYNGNSLHIHARSLETPDGKYAPHENMLKAAFASMAAVAGGCDSLTIEGAVDTSLFQRWAVNVSNILREESFLDRVANPLSGAYAPEAISDTIARKAWEIFQHQVKAL